MSKRKDRWGPSALPGLARAQARAEREKYTKYQQYFRAKRHDPRSPQTWEKYLDSLVHMTDIPSVQNSTREDVFYMHQVAGVLETTTLYWVTAPMTQVAMQGSEKVPEIYPDRDMPTPTGLMAFEKPLPPLYGFAWGTFGNTVKQPSDSPISALLWRTDGDDVVVTARIWIGHHAPLPPNTTQRTPYEPLHTAGVVRIPRRRAQNLDELDVEPEDRYLMAFLSTAWVQMMTPTLAQRTTIDPKTGGTPRPGVPASPPLVTTIDLRPIRHTDFSESDEKTGTVFTHRFVVRGHWRNQAYGTGHAQHRMTWIPAYIKGPESAPLLPTEKVMVWRR